MFDVIVCFESCNYAVIEIQEAHISRDLILYIPPDLERFPSTFVADTCVIFLAPCFNRLMSRTLYMRHDTLSPHLMSW